MSEKIVDSEEQPMEGKKPEEYFFRASAADFKKIPSSPIAYWVSDKFLSIFGANSILGDETKARQGLATGDNGIFARLWFEISISNFYTKAGSCEETLTRPEKWYPYHKGGEFRRWYGNILWVVNWKNDGTEVRNFRDSNGKLRSRPQNTDCYFQDGITWSDVTSGYLSVRSLPKGCIYDISGHSAFPEKGRERGSILAYLNTKFAKQTAKMLNPTLHFQIGDYQSFPYPKDFICDVNANTSELCIKLSRDDWDSYETSWDFTSLPLLQYEYRQATLKETYQKLRRHWFNMTMKMQQLEEENNRIFIEAYGLQDELTPDVPLKEITLTCNPHYRYGGDKTAVELETLLLADTMKEFISYAVGCMMGRYSLDKEGLILANQGETLADYLKQVPDSSFSPDEDGIVPVSDYPWFDDDASNRFFEFVATAWTEDVLDENLAFIAASLNPKRGESPRDTIRRYISQSFFKDHLKRYKKRPIYWLFSSGRERAFECMVYLHRYNEGTLARMRTEYVIPLSGKLNARVDHLREEAEQAAGSAARNRLLRELQCMEKKREELRQFDEKLRHYADQRISIDLDDGVKVNYGKFNGLLAEVKAVTGKK